MALIYTNELIESALTYPEYRQLINDTLVSPPVDAAAEKNAALHTKKMSF